MGKKRSQKDRAYITATEWREEGGGHRGRLQGTGSTFKRLPFNCCAISFQPIEDAVCTMDGTVMEIVNAVPYVQKHKRHPTTGQPLDLRDLVRIHFYRNADGEIACPVLGKVFNENTHIVAVRPSGNVYCWEAIDELCLKPKHLRDLLTDETFTKKDIIQIQDPLNLSGKNLAEFDHMKYGRTVGDESDQAEATQDPLFGIKVVDEDTKRALAALGTDEAAAAFAAGGGGKKAQAERALAEAKAQSQATGDGRGTRRTDQSTQHDPRLRSAPRDPNATASFKPGTATWNTDAPTISKDRGGASTSAYAFDPNAGRSVPSPFSHQYIASHVSTGAASKSFTSTSMPVSTRNERTMILQQLKPLKKGYLQLHTTLGDVNLELHCDIVPKTCENFLALAEGGYYTGTCFHRSIKNFMIQGGDPTGTGKGGVSVFGDKGFPDEFDSRLLHDGRGVLSMANSGPGTNGSQFFILYKSARHLDSKHSVFGRVVGGFDTLTKMEKVATDDEDRLLQQVQITGVTVFVNPYKDLLEEEKRKKELLASGGGGTQKVETSQKDGEAYGAWFSDPAAGAKSAAAAATAADCMSRGSGGVGKYMKNCAAVGEGTVAAKKAKKMGSGNTLSHFDAW